MYEEGQNNDKEVNNAYKGTAKPQLQKCETEYERG